MRSAVLTATHFLAAGLMGWLYVIEGIDFFEAALDLIAHAPNCRPRSRLYCDFWSVPGRREFHGLLGQWAWLLVVQSVVIPLSRRFNFIQAFPGAVMLFGAPLVLALFPFLTIAALVMLLQSATIYVVVLLGLLAAAAAGMVAASDILDDIFAR